jgi:hypothetical protein
MGYPGQVLVPVEELVNVQKRIAILEELAGQLTAGQGLACAACRTKPGAVRCPVCLRLFCDADWVVHVQHGCQAK